MIYLLLSIICSTIISVVFRLFKDYEIDTFQAIIYNYFVCLIIGTAVMGEIPIQESTIYEPWFPYAGIMGGIFIFTFILIARSIQNFGISITAVMQRMSLIITVIYAIWAFGEAITTFKILGILVALAAVVFATLNPKEVAETSIKNRWTYFLPLVVLLLSGTIESVLQYVQIVLLTSDVGQLQFTTTLFGTAAVVGIFVLIVNLISGRMVFKWKHLIGGVALGVPNFGSIFFILKMLDQGWDSSVVFPINNVGVIVVSAVVALLFFKEKLSKMNKFGILLAIVAIVLIAYAQYLISNN